MRMLKKSSKTSNRRLTLSVGFIALCIVGGWYISGSDRLFELISYDIRMKSLSSAPPCDDIIHIDITDESLDSVGRWPWPRETLAGILDIITESGADITGIDIIMPEPQAVRFTSDKADAYFPSEAIVTADSTSGPLPVFDDSLFAGALFRNNNCLLPMHVDTVNERKLSDLQHRLEEIFEAGFAKNPLVSFDDAMAAVSPELLDACQVERACLARQAYLRQRAIASLGRFAIVPKQLTNYRFQAGSLVPPLVTFANACSASGFVTVDPDMDGTVRRIPLIMQADGKYFPQFALALAIKSLGRDHGKCTISGNSNRVLLSFSDGFERVIPVDKDGYMLINWLRQDHCPERSTEHISILSVEAIWRNRQRLERNLRRKRIYQIELADLLEQARLIELLHKADGLHRQRLAAEFEQYSKRLFTPAEVDLKSPESPRALLEKERELEREISVEAEGLLDEFYVQGVPDDDSDKIKILGYQQSIREIEHADAQIKKLNAKLLHLLRQKIQGRVCLIGSVATGAADFVPTPMNKRMPGVEVHSNIANTIISGKFIKPIPGLAAFAVFVIMGLVVILVSAFMRIQWAWPVVIFIGAAYIGVSGLCFTMWNIVLPIASPLAALSLGFVAVTTCRVLTEERAKKRIRGMFAKSLSHELVDRLVSDPSMFRLGGERRVLTSLFSDLEGFTTFSEQLGEQKTVKLLNRYFDRMTEVLQNRRGGYISKFLGDGIFAFFGAPVAFEDHSTRAIHAAVECLEQVDLLNRELLAETGQRSTLRCRIGIATGDVMVGNCGSSERFDYTAIGDTVNLAARLEAANKFFTTGTLIAAGAYESCRKELFIARPFGKIRVVGKKETTAVWNVQYLAENASDEIKLAFAEFTKAIQLYQKRNFTEAAAIFNELHRQDTSDKPASIFANLCNNYAQNPPPDDWQCVLELTDKFK